MRREVDIILAEDDNGHAFLIRSNLERAGIMNKVIHLKDGQEVLDFLFMKGRDQNREEGKSYLILLDIRMPKIDGIEVLKEIKSDPELKKMPVVMISTSDNPDEIHMCHMLGCNSYITKPIEYNKFVDTIRKLGMYLMIVEVPVTVPK